MALGSGATLLSNATATGTAVAVNAGRYAFMCDGTFSGATVTLQILGPDGSSYLSAGSDAALTAEGAVLVELPNCSVRALVASGPPSGMYATLTRIGD